MKEGWVYKKLGEVCIIERGGSPRPIKDYITNDTDGLNWIKIGDTDPQGKYIYSTKEKIIPTGLKKTRWVNVDDFLLSNSMSFGRPYILKTNGCIHDGWLVLREYQQNLNTDFFYYLLLSPTVQRQFKQKAQGSTVSNLNTQRVSDVEVSFPTLAVQQRIVSNLDTEFAKIEALKDNAEKQLQAAKDLFQAALKELMTPKDGWVEKKLREVCIIERGGSPRPIKDYITNDSDGLNWIKIGDTDPQGKYIYSTKEKIKSTGLKKTRFVNVDDFLLSNSMSFGRPYILKTNGCIHDGWLVLSEYQHNLNIDFFYYLLLSSNVQRQFKQKAQGSTVSNLNTQRVSGVEISFPTKAEQQRIADRLDALSANVKALQTNYTETITLCNDLKQALLKKVFE